MQWIIPGTTLTGDREQADSIDNLFQSLFLAGGLTLSQVASITGLEPYTIQNWVKRKFLAPPQGKRYDMEQVCRLININICNERQDWLLLCLWDILLLILSTCNCAKDNQRSKHQIPKLFHFLLLFFLVKH